MFFSIQLFCSVIFNTLLEIHINDVDMFVEFSDYSVLWLNQKYIFNLHQYVESVI